MIKYLICSKCFIVVCFFSFTDAVFGLKGVRIWNPEAIRAGELLRLSCDYDLEGVPLYSIKWYFGDQEFYRFVPKESPPTRVFPLSGTTSVDVSSILYFIQLMSIIYTGNVSTKK